MSNNWPTGWQVLALEDAMSAIIDYRGKTPRKTDTGVPLVTAKIVKNGRIETPTEFIDPLEYDDWMRRGIPEVGDVLITTEAPLGEVAQLRDARVALAQRLIALRGRPGVLNNSYLRFLLTSSYMQDQLLARASGTTVVGIKQSELRQIELPLPPIETQESVAEILGALDEKIELNRRMNGLLEGMARAIFKAWFIDFEPVKAKAAGATSFSGMPQRVFDELPKSFTNSELGDIPEGWRIVTVADVTHRVTKGDTPRQSAIAAAPDNDAMVRMVRANAITEDGEILHDKLVDIPQSIHFGKSKRSILEPNFILYTNAGTIGRVAFVTEDLLPANTNQAVAIIQPDSSKVPPKFLYLAMRQPEFQDELHLEITQAVQANLALGKISEAKIVVPQYTHLPTMFSSLESMLDLIWANRRESAALAKMRDSLLPKLISGELRVCR